MTNTLQLISIQHELGMAIGLDLRLRPMLRLFTSVCIRRLGLSGMQFFFMQDAAGGFTRAGAAEQTSLQHYLSVPDGSNGVQTLELPQFDFENVRQQCEHIAAYKRDSGEWVYSFNLGELGMAVLHRANRPIADNMVNLLLPIFQRLTVSCQASMDHEQLLDAIEAREKAEQLISFQALHDELTQLPNRRLLMENLSRDISRSRRHGFLGAVLFIDLNRFKIVNDTLGHAVGDQLLVAVANILTGIVRAEDTVARLSGDEFVVQLSKIKAGRSQGVASVERIVEKIKKAFVKPIRAGEHRLQVTPSIGIEIYPYDDVTADQVLHHADTAMYQAKAEGPNCSAFYDRKLSADLKLRLELEKELQLAVKQPEQFELWYQPQYSAAGFCIGAEALLRWNNPNRDFVSPAHFVPIAEETGLMVQLGRWVIVRACQQLMALQAAGLPETFDKLSVNVSAVQFNQSNFVSDLHDILAATAVHPGLLCIELTESTLIKNVDDAVSTMNQLREHGIPISIDDFGTGYSSLAYLNRFPIETLKVDQTFVRNIHADSGNRAIVDAIMALGRSMQLSIIAEGVETAEELACLQELGCQHYQGYYFGRPVPFDELQTIVRQQR